MEPQVPASDPGETPASPASAPPVPDRGGGRGRFPGGLVEILGGVTDLFAASTPGLAILAVLGIKALVALSGGAAGGWLRILDTAGTLVLAAVLGYLLVRLLKLLRQRFLWRVRRKLVLSYVLIGFVPILLSGVFFLVSGALLVLTVSSSFVQLSFADVLDDARGLAAMTSIDLRGRVAPEAMRAVLAERVRAVRERYPEASIAVSSAGRDRAAAADGPWRHAAADPTFPPWLRVGTADSAAGGLVVTQGPAGWTLAARGVQRFDADGRTHAVIADLPIAGDVARRMQASRGVVLTHLQVTPPVADADRQDAGARGRAVRVAFAASDGAGQPAPSLSSAADLVRGWSMPSVAYVDLLDWSTGALRQQGQVLFSVNLVTFFCQIAQGGADSIAPFLCPVRPLPVRAEGGDDSMAWFFLAGMAVLGVIFLTIEAAAMVMGFALATSITGAVHELFTGTERVRQGDLAHRIRIDTRDQLGELAESFNAMTGSIANLLTEAEEKRRLEEELRIAREIQMSLLPAGPASVPGLAVTAACRPAREVGGDYYDFIRLDEHRLGVLVADVSGKGTSAAFYMAELKGVVLSLSRFHHSPRELLIEVNRILSASLDSRTFITMTYAVCDLAERRMTYARAGHTPLIHVSSAAAGTPVPEVLAPDGLVVGLQFEGAGEKFAELLEEAAFPVETGDLVALFTDGVTEAMNVDADLFGEERLSRALADHVHLPSHELKQRILGDVEAFAGAAEQHDDMTIVLLRVGEPPAPAPPPGRP